jgi:alkanesulfonate monooxygenase SsuD/methylene tetrahydromethanopterin reductase-like flavin-dependent oxidoreductase (luciferase family)
VKIGIFSLGEYIPDPSGVLISQGQRLEEIVESAVLAEEAGLYGIALGEHHAVRYAVSTPPVILAAIAARTTRIRLRTAVTLIGTLDPVRAAEDYATVDVLSGGRVDLVTGKGIYREPFELFGPTWEEIDEAMWEKTDLLIRLLTETDVHWTGKFRTPINGFTTQPRPVDLPVWCGMGRSMSSPERAALRGMPLMIANIITVATDHLPRLAHYRETWARAGRDPAGIRIAGCCACHVARTSQEARRRWEPYYRNYYESATKSGGSMREMPPWTFESRIGPGGASICGSPAEVVDKLLELREMWHHDEHFFQMDIGGLPFEYLAEAIELVGSEVLPQLEQPTAQLHGDPVRS